MGGFDIHLNTYVDCKRAADIPAWAVFTHQTLAYAIFCSRLTKRRLAASRRVRRVHLLHLFHLLCHRLRIRIRIRTRIRIRIRIRIPSHAADCRRFAALPPLDCCEPTARPPRQYIVGAARSLCQQGK